MSPLNIIKPNYFEKSSTPPNQITINNNLANATANAAAALKLAQQQQQQDLTNRYRPFSNNHQDNNNSNISTATINMPRSPSQAFSNNNYEIIQSMPPR